MSLKSPKAPKSPEVPDPGKLRGDAERMAILEEMRRKSGGSYSTVLTNPDGTAREPGTVLAKGFTLDPAQQKIIDAAKAKRKTSGIPGNPFDVARANKDAKEVAATTKMGFTDSFLKTLLGGG